MTETSERLFEFEADDAHWHVELRNTGLFGFDLFFYKNGEPDWWKHFDFRAQAVSWAEAQRWIVQTARKSNCTYYPHVDDWL